MGRIATIVEGQVQARGVAKATTKPGSKVDKRSQAGAPAWAKSGRWVNVVSSNVRSIKYDKAAKVLWVRFKEGATYHYNGVSQQLAVSMFNSASMGKFVWRLRRAGYVGVKSG